MADKAKAPQRNPNQIAADIARERAQLDKAFDTLRGDMNDAAQSDNQTLAAGRKALLLVPAMVVAAAATAGGVIAGLRRVSEEQGAKAAKAAKDATAKKS